MRSRAGITGRAGMSDNGNTPRWVFVATMGAVVAAGVVGLVHQLATNMTGDAETPLVAGIAAACFVVAIVVGVRLWFRPSIARRKLLQRRNPDATVLTVTSQSDFATNLVLVRPEAGTRFDSSARGRYLTLVASTGGLALWSGDGAPEQLARFDWSEIGSVEPVEVGSRAGAIPSVLLEVRGAEATAQVSFAVSRPGWEGVFPGRGYRDRVIERLRALSARTSA